MKKWFIPISGDKIGEIVVCLIIFGGLTIIFEACTQKFDRVDIMLPENSCKTVIKEIKEIKKLECDEAMDKLNTIKNLYEKGDK